MLTSELILKLEKLKQQFGNLPIKLVHYGTAGSNVQPIGAVEPVYSGDKPKYIVIDPDSK